MAPAPPPSWAKEPGAPGGTSLPSPPTGPESLASRGLPPRKKLPRPENAGRRCQTPPRAPQPGRSRRRAKDTRERRPRRGEPRSPPPPPAPKRAPSLHGGHPGPLSVPRRRPAGLGRSGGRRRRRRWSEDPSSCPPGFSSPCPATARPGPPLPSVPRGLGLVGSRRARTHLVEMGEARTGHGAGS